MKFVNLTPHRLNVYGSTPPTDQHEPFLVLESSGVARLRETRTDRAPVGGFPTTMVNYADAVDLPEPEPDVVLICSMLVSRWAQRADVVSPGPSIRDERGRIVGCVGFTRWAV